MAKKYATEYNEQGQNKGMRIRISKDVFNEEHADADLTVVPFGAVGEIDYATELSGDTKELVALGRLSKRSTSGGGYTIVGAPSKNRAIRRLSGFLFENGRLSSIFDVNVGSAKYSPSYGVGVFNCKGTKCGVLLGDDCYSLDLVKALSLYGCGLIIDLYPDLLTEMRETAARFYSFTFGLDYLTVASDRAAAYAAGGLKKNFDSEIVLLGRRIFSEVKIKKAGN